MPKRKRSSPPDASATTGTSKSSNQDAINAIFRANFESKFGSIDISPVVPQTSNASSEDDDQDDSENDLEDEDSDLNLEDGDLDDDMNENDNNPKVEVITYDFSRRGPPPTTKPSRRSFMSSKPPTSSASSTSKPQPTSKLSKSEEAAEVLHLKNDIALRNLLSESHLLDSTLSHSNPKNRHKAIESRVIALGGKPLKQKGNIPMAIQKGMKAKQKSIAEKVKREAKVNGVVMDKESKRAKERRKNKERQERRKGEGRGTGVGHAKVGKFRGGELRLSRRDVAAMMA
ncbi:uncharacterized protein DFL_001228 [Arthrobotrys flagrans]|uniref:Uncharacterized protein n=1 Tax=Arthrobotrys flagrans TaxID=97331 RepID=A0A437AGI5_ARTFL|nr:hypothetical protein DFL_001228 [Arthrobotrys flagrans]